MKTIGIVALLMLTACANYVPPDPAALAAEQAAGLERAKFWQQQGQQQLNAITAVNQHYQQHRAMTCATTFVGNQAYTNCN